MNPFWMQSSYQATVTSALGFPQPLAPALSGSQPVYNGRGNVVFGTCDEIHKHDSTRELVEADGIVQGLESLSIPPWQNKDPRQDHDHDPVFLFFLFGCLCLDPIRWPPASPSDKPSAKGVSRSGGEWVFKRKAFMLLVATSYLY
jgi:hypothetical protein